MENILNKFLKKVGVEDFSELTEMEKATYQEWEKILSQDVKINDVAKFLEAQINRLNKELRAAVTEAKDREALRITAKIENYEAIIIFIKEPLERRKALEEQLLNQLN